MATVRDICARALRRIGVTSRGEASDPTDIADALTVFNAIMDELVLAGWVTSHTTQTLSDTFALDGAYNEPMSAEIGCRLASEFERPISRDLKSDADRLLEQLANAALTADGAGQKFERGLWDFRPGGPLYDT